MAIPITTTEIGEFVRYKSCERRIKLATNDRNEARRLPFYGRLFNAIDPVLQSVGRRREDEWELGLEQEGLGKIEIIQPEEDERETQSDLTQFFSQLENVVAGSQYFGREVVIIGDIGNFTVRGRIDFLILLWREGVPLIRIVECKASRKDKTYHRIQVALYQRLLENFLTQNEYLINGIRLSSEHVESVVARIDEETNQRQDILTLEALILDRELEDVEKLLEEHGHLHQIIEADIDDLDYCLEQKCDDCLFNVHCLTESSRFRKIQLLGVNSTTLKILEEYGISTIDELADLDPRGQQAQEIRNHIGFSQNLGFLVKKAQARRATLPRTGDQPDGEYPVMALRYDQHTTLPAYVCQNTPLVRVYMSVDYDYVENRIVALSAHVTKSLHPIRTRYDEADVVEEIRNDGEEPQYQILTGESVIKILPTCWNGNYGEDNGMERFLIEAFFRDLANTIARIAGTEMSPVHFYVWSRTEIRHIMEACGRLGTGLLASFQHLLGCRESLEQLIFSSIEDEVKHNFGLGWTGRGLGVVTSLTWFGKRYNWRRVVDGEVINLEHIFTQDIFDFKTDLELTLANEWGAPGDPNTTRHKFEIRSRFNDGLTVPYFHAYWRTLPDTHRNRQVQNALERYQRASEPNYMETYLEARTHALRWVEGFIRKNNEIEKPHLNVRQLNAYTLDVHETRQAAINFLRLDHHVKFNDWLSKNLRAPINRISSGEALPLINITVSHENHNQVTAEIDTQGIGVSLEHFSAISNIQEGSFARFSPCDETWERGQTIGQLIRGGGTCTVDSIDWETGMIVLSVMFARDTSSYIVRSISTGNRAGGDVIYDCAVLDNSISDFVANRVSGVLHGTTAGHINDWFHPTTPRIPEHDPYSQEQRDGIRNLIDTFRYGGEDNYQLHEGQRDAIIDGLRTRIQLLLGPPGTGKTMTTAVSVLCKILLKHTRGDIIFLSGHTHRAVDELLLRVRSVVAEFSHHAESLGYNLPNLFIAKTAREEEEVPNGIEFLPVNTAVTAINRNRGANVIIIGGTISGILKLSQKFNGAATFRQTGFYVNTMIIDEASMMVFPSFLALSTVVSVNGEIMLAGDHNQLSPIVAHDWDREDRPTVILYQPFLSSYDSMRRIREYQRITDHSILISSLTYTYRLPQVIRNLIARLYQEDDVVLEGRVDNHTAPEFTQRAGWESVWNGDSGLFLITHDERNSRKSNLTEIDIIQQILESFHDRNGGNTIPEDNIALVTPHRAQRTLLKQRFEEDYANSITVIDTVERLQGGERPTVIVSATASDPAAISATAEFVLNLNRANVAFSRSQERLIVVCSQSLLNHIPSDVDHYDSALLWKTLRRICSRTVAEITIGEEVSANIFTVARREDVLE
ncbi:MAG: AAA domain-containing protein [Bacteroidota bacterium]